MSNNEPSIKDFTKYPCGSLDVFIHKTATLGNNPEIIQTIKIPFFKPLLGAKDIFLPGKNQ